MIKQLVLIVLMLIVLLLILLLQQQQQLSLPTTTRVVSCQHWCPSGHCRSSGVAALNKAAQTHQHGCPLFLAELKRRRQVKTSSVAYQKRFTFCTCGSCESGRALPFVQSIKRQPPLCEGVLHHSHQTHFFFWLFRHRLLSSLTTSYYHHYYYLPHSLAS